MLKPKFNKKQKTIKPEPSKELVEQPLEQHMRTRPTSKSESQKCKNEKLKWKQRTRQDFQNKLTRPIYYKYDFRKIRAQLRDDNIHTSHQITVNRKYREVIIGFKSRQELEHATNIIKINYFLKARYIVRWGANDQLLNKNLNQNQLLKLPSRYIQCARTHIS